MREIQVAEHKTLKLTNVLARKVDGSELGNLPVVLTQMQNFIRSHNAMPVGPIIQCVKMRTGPNPSTGASPHWFFGDGMVHGVRLAGGKAQW